MNSNSRLPYRAAFCAIVLALTVACSRGEGAGSAATVDPAAAAAATLESAMQADRDFAAMAKADGPKAAFQHWMDPADSAFIQPGAMIKGAEAIAAGFDGGPPGFSAQWAPDGGHGSLGGDVAVTTGRYALFVGGQEIEKGRYVTTWRRNDTGEWKGMLDVSSADPPPPPPADPNGRPG